MGPIKLSGMKSVLFFGGCATFLGLALYPTVIYPYFHIEEYKNVQKFTRAGIDQEKIQPGGMKVWSDPFDRKNN